MCVSFPCYQEVYLKGENPLSGQLEFDIKKDPLELVFRNCCLHRWSQSQ